MDKHVIPNFIPILLLFLLICYTKTTTEISHTILGKFFAVSLIVYYITIDPMIGFVVCALIILFYQSNYQEGAIGISNVVKKIQTSAEKATEDAKKKIEEAKKKADSEDLEKKRIIAETTDEIADKAETSLALATIDVDTKRKTANVAQIAYEAADKVKLTEFKNNNTEKFTDYTPTSQPQYNEKTDFIQKHCQNNQLFHKQYLVKTDMTEFVFPSVKFESSPCNVCDPTTCKYSIVKNKLQIEEELMTPINSNDWFQDAMIKIQGIFTDPTPVLRIGSTEPFSLYT